MSKDFKIIVHISLVKLQIACLYAFCQAKSSNFRDLYQHAIHHCADAQ